VRDTLPGEGSARVVAPARAPFRFDGRVPGDKSISHRVALLSLLAEGESTVAGYAPGADCAFTLAAVRALGARVEGTAAEGLRILPPAGGVREPEDVVDAGNSGTLARLAMGLVAGAGRYAVLTGDASLRGRPMGRVVRPLAALGARIAGRAGGERLPVTVLPSPLRAGEVALEVASAQVKSAVLLAGMFTAGETAVVEPAPTRDHTERLLRAAGVAVCVEAAGAGRRVRVRGPARPRAMAWRVPGDASSAAFLFAAALLTGGEARVRDLGVNPGRTAFLDVLRAMGAEVAVEGREEWQGEPVATVTVRPGGEGLRGARVGPEGIAAVIDELPLVAALAAAARGRTEVRGAGELRHKESDRIAAMVEGLAALGVRAGEHPDGFWVEGPAAVRGGRVDARGDHRVAMAFGVLALAAEAPVEVAGAAAADVSFPAFWQVLEGA
jgi:3-phosphoshikimate 1-carboxyvinyltransferase